MIIPTSLFQRWAAPNYQFWTRLPVWGHADAAALVIGRDPRKSTEMVVYDYASDDVAKAERAAVVGAYKDMRDLLGAAVRLGQLSEHETPERVMQWLDRRGISYPEELKEALQFAADGEKSPDDEVARLRERVAKLEAEIAKLRETRSSGELAEITSSGTTKRLRSHQKLVLAMAIDKFRHDPRAERGTAVTNILNALARVGLKLDAGTTLSILRDAFHDIGLPIEDQRGSEGGADDADAVLPQS